MRIVLIVLFSFIAFANAQGQNNLSGTTVTSHPYDIVLKSSLEKYTIFEMDVVKSALDFDNAQSFIFDTGSKSFDLSVYPRNLTVSYREKNLPHLLGGHSSNGESLNFTINDDFIYGFIRIGDKRLFIEPLRYFDRTAPRNYFVSYWDYDVIITGEHKCGVETTDLKTEELEVERVITDECIYVEYALANTHDMVVEFGSVGDVEDFNLAVLNTVQANYRSEFDMNVEYDIVAHFTPSTAGADPFTSSANAVTLLTDFSNWADGGGSSGGSSGGFGVNYQMAGLWTDRDIFTTNPTNFGVVGVAWTPGWHHLLENFTSDVLQLQVMVSHEIGHNWDAVHDAGSGFLMSASVNGTDVWSSPSVSDIEARINSQGFLDDCSDLGSPVANFNQSTIITCQGGVVEFEDQSQYGATRVWEFSNGTPATSIDEKVSVTYNTPGQHYVKVTSTNGAGSSEYTYYVDVQSAPGNPCTPSGSGGSGGIVNVSLENVVNPSDDAAAAGRYEDFSCEQIMSLEPSTSYDIIISTSGGSSTGLRLYIDNNNDGDFTDGGELEGNFTLGGGNNYLIPFTTAANPVEDEVIRFRIINDIGSISGSCENPTYSQVEDYGIVFSTGVEPVFGCTDPTAGNYDPLATVDDGSCTVPLFTWYRDFDSDDFGDANTTLMANTLPLGYVADDTDCNDTDDTIFPGASEVCDGKINNCNFSVLLAIEVDNDGDGYVECNYNAATWAGDPSVIGGNDCDDTDDTKYPGAPEICDGQRNDCNLTGIPISEIDNDGDGHVECSYSSSTWVGSPLVIGGGDCDDTDSDNFLGNTEICDGEDNDCDGVVDEGCFDCDGVNITVSTITQNTYSVEGTIVSDALIDETVPVYFFAEGDIELNDDFEVVLGTEFYVDNETCIDNFNSDDTIYFVQDSDAKNQLVALVDQLDQELNSDTDDLSIIIMSMNQELIFDGKKNELLIMSAQAISDLFGPDTFCIVKLQDGTNQVFGKFARL